MTIVLKYSTYPSSCYSKNKQTKQNQIRNRVIHARFIDDIRNHILHALETNIYNIVEKTGAGFKCHLVAVWASTWIEPHCWWQTRTDNQVEWAIRSISLTPTESESAEELLGINRKPSKFLVDSLTRNQRQMERGEITYQVWTTDQPINPSTHLFFFLFF